MRSLLAPIESVSFSYKNIYHLATSIAANWGSSGFERPCLSLEATKKTIFSIENSYIQSDCSEEHECFRQWPTHVRHLVGSLTDGVKLT